MSIDFNRVSSLRHARADMRRAASARRRRGRATARQTAARRSTAAAAAAAAAAVGDADGGPTHAPARPTACLNRPKRNAIINQRRAAINQRINQRRAATNQRHAPRTGLPVDKHAAPTTARRADARRRRSASKAAAATDTHALKFRIVEPVRALWQRVGDERRRRVGAANGGAGRKSRTSQTGSHCGG